AQLAAVAGAAGITKGANYAATVSAAATVADLNIIDANTTGVITASITDAAANLDTLTGTGNAYTMTVSAGSVAATVLTSLDAKTAVAVDAAAVTTITGTAAEIVAVAAEKSAATLSLAAGVATTVSAGSAAATDLTAIDAMTTTAVGAAAVTAITGTAAEIVAAIGAAGITTSTTYNATVSGPASVADLLAIDTDTSGTLTYTSITDTAAHLATLSGSTWTVNAYVVIGTNVIVSDTVGTAALAAIDAANGTGTVTAAATLLSAPNTYLVATSASPVPTIANNVVATVIDSAGAQTIHIASGGKLNLIGSDGHNVIVFDAYAPGALDVSRSGATVIFTDHSTAKQIASIATDASYAPSQTIRYSDASQVELTLVGTALALGGVAISTVGSIL
ncbi:MAG: hypothetical protein D4R84_11140, partial [Rhodocyclaceae bacterium]